MYCFGTVSWNGYLERYINIFVNNYITLYRGLIHLGINDCDIAEPKIICVNEVLGSNTKSAIQKLKDATGKKLKLTIIDKNKYTEDTIMYSTRNALRIEFANAFPKDKKVFFYFSIDDYIRPETVFELIHLSKQTVNTACMFKFFVKQARNNFTAGTRPICSYKDIHPEDWGRILRIYYFKRK